MSTLAGDDESAGPVPPLTGFLHYAPASLPAVLRSWRSPGGASRPVLAS
jgi:hypothetical protein